MLEGLSAGVFGDARIWVGCAVRLKGKSVARAVSAVGFFGRARGIFRQTSKNAQILRAEALILLWHFKNPEGIERE